MRPFPALGFRARLSALVAGVAIVVACLIAWLLLERQTEALRLGLVEQSVRSSEVLAHSFTSLILRETTDVIPELAEEMLRARSSDPGAPVVYLEVVDRAGKILYTTEDDGTPVLDPEVARILSANASGAERSETRVVASRDQGLVLDVSVPCGVDGVDGVFRGYGAVRLGVGLGPLLERRSEALRIAVTAAFGAISFGLLLGLLVTGGMVRAMDRMAEVVSRIAEGDLTPRIKSERGDELGQLAGAIDRMAEDLQKRDLLKRYISATAWEEIEEKGISYSEEQDVRMEEVTVLFLDIRNYTSLSETYESREIVSILNDVFTVLIQVVDEFGGVIDKFIGDALLVVFYPGAEADDAVRAVYAGARMQESVRDFSARREFYGREPITVGIGINTGTVIAGSVGSRDRRDFTVIGDPVNVASRLQERSKEGRHSRVVLSEATYRLVASLVEVAPLEGSTVRGRREEIQAYELVHLKDLKGILDSLEHDDPRVREEAFQALEATGGPVAIPHLVKVLGGAREGAVLKAIPILARLGSESDAVMRLLVGMIESADDHRLLATAIRSLGNLRGFRDVDLLGRFLSHPDPRVRANTIESLDGMGPEGHLDRIEELLEDPHQRVKANAAVVLWKRGRRRVVDSLVAMAGSPRPQERAAAVFAMGELFVSEAEEAEFADPGEVAARIREDSAAYRRLGDALVARLADPSPEVVAKAVAAVSRARDTGSLPRLAELATGVEGPVSQAALAALARIGPTARVARLLRRWRQLTGRGLAAMPRVGRDPVPEDEAAAGAG